jgi:hypothetical protein
LLTLWKDADPDFQKLRDLTSVLQGKPISNRFKYLGLRTLSAVVNRMSFMYLDPAFFDLSSKGPSPKI